jgi:hypothetical protein
VGLELEMELFLLSSSVCLSADFVIILFECLEKLCSFKSIFRHE